MRSLLRKAKETFQSCVQRNKMIIKVVTIAFFTIILLSIFMAVLVSYTAPRLLEELRPLAQSEIPPPFTGNLYFYIFLNNVGHFWNPIKMLVWVPLLGTLILGSELLLNGGVIGIIAVKAGITRGIFYPIVGLTPHGVLEIPAFILQFASIIRWHVTAVDTIMTKITGKKGEDTRFKQGVKDTVVLGLASVILFIAAAAIETYITPYLLGI